MKSTGVSGVVRGSGVVGAGVFAGSVVVAVVSGGISLTAGSSHRQQHHSGHQQSNQFLAHWWGFSFS